MKNLFFYTLFIFVFIGGTQAQSQVKLLTKAYNQKSSELLARFFNNWQQEMPTVSQLNLDTMNKAVREAYQVFGSVYIPFHKKNNQPAFDSLFNRKYILIQGEISFNVIEKVHYTEAEEVLAIKHALDSLGYDSLRVHAILLPKNRSRIMGSLYNRYLNEYVYNKPKNGENTISFRPFVRYEDLIPLYLNGRYVNLIEDFLGKNFFHQDITIPKFKKSKEISMKKFDFLRTYSYGISYGCFIGDCWRFIDGPSISRIVFDRDFRYANAHYWDGDSEYVAQLKKGTDGEWEIVFINLVAEV